MRAHLLLLLAATLSLPGCGDSTSPPPVGDFDPEALRTGVGRILDGLNGPELAIYREATDEIADYFGNIGFISNRSPLAPACCGIAASLTRFPEFLKGQVYEWDTTNDRYDDTALPGAPATGSRFLVYQISGIAFAEPLVEAGHIDLLDHSESASIVQLVAVIEGASQADLTATSTGTLQDGTLRLAGFIGTGADRVDIDISALNTVTATGTASTYNAVLEVGGLSSEVETTVDRGPVVTYDTRISITSPDGDVLIEGQFDGEEFAGTAQVNGTPYAELMFEGAGVPVVTGTGDIDLTDSETNLFSRAVELIQSPTDYLDVLLPPFIFPLEVEPGGA